MQSTLFTNSNEIYELLEEYVNVQYLSAADKANVRDIFIYDHFILPEGHGDEIRFTIQELKQARPQWNGWLLQRLKDRNIPHDRYLYDGRRYYTIFPDIASDDIIFSKTIFWPENFCPDDLLFTTCQLNYNCRGDILRLLKIPRLAKGLEQELYCRVDLGCPLSHYELQESLRQAFTELLQSNSDSMET